jgi:hypothetical protein
MNETGIQKDFGINAGVYSFSEITDAEYLCYDFYTNESFSRYGFLLPRSWRGLELNFINFCDETEEYEFAPEEENMLRGNLSYMVDDYNGCTIWVEEPIIINIEETKIRILERLFDILSYILNKRFEKILNTLKKIWIRKVLME